MSMIDLNPNMKLILPAGSKHDFYLYHLILREGLSRISTAELTLFSSNNSIRMKEMNELIGKYATIELTQTLSEHGGQCRRYFTGMVTEAIHCGIAHTGKDFNTFKYGLQICTPEAGLQFGRHRRSFPGWKVSDVLSEIIKPYGFRCAVINNVPDQVPNWNEPDNFYQNGESDYSFLLRILIKYGLSYIMVSHKTDGHIPGACDMVFSCGSDYQVSAYEIADAQNPIPCTCRDAIDGHLSVSNWRMSSRLGTDYAAVNYEDGMNYAAKSAGDDQSARQIFFNHPPMGTMKDETAENIMKNYLRSLRQTSSQWEGDVMRLDAMPGMRLNILDFYGDSDTVKARITASELTFTAPWPVVLLGESPDVSTQLNIHVNCMDSNDGKNFATPALPEPVPCAEKMETTTSPVRFAFQKEESSGIGQTVPFQAVQAVVCDDKGNTSSSQVEANHSLFLRNSAYEFYACYMVGDKKEIVVVTLMMPLGGFGEGLFHVPRQGDKVLIACVNCARYYLMGYLPDSNRSFVNNNLLNGKMADVDNMTVLRRNRPGQDPQDYMNCDENMMITQDDRLVAAGEDAAKQRPNHKFSEIGIYYGTQNEQNGK